MASPIEGKVCLVTGANRGIGKAFVDVFLKHGAAKVYAGVRNMDAYKSESDKVVPMLMDLSQPSTIVEAASQSHDVDVVVNNAGILSRTQALDEMAIDRLKEEMDVNVYGVLRMAQAYIPILQPKTTPTAFVQINSVASFRCGLPNVATYSASKAAAYSVTQALQQQVASSKVKVVSVHPGPIRTDMISTASAELAQMAEPPEQVAEEVVEALSKESEGLIHVFPDSKSKQLGVVLKDYTTTVIEQGKMYG